MGDWTSWDHRGGIKRAFVSPIGGTELFRLPTQGLLLMTLANVVTGITTISMSGCKLTILANLTHVLFGLTFYIDPPPQSLSIQQFPFPDSKPNISFPLLPQVSNLYKRANQFRRSLLHDLKVVTDNADELLYPMPIVNCCQLCVIIPGLLGRSLEEPSA